MNNKILEAYIKLKPHAEEVAKLMKDFKTEVEKAFKEVKLGHELIAEERQRQISMWTNDHQYTDGDLKSAAFAYLEYANRPAEVRDSSPFSWPWDNKLFRPGKDNSASSRVRELTKAGALIAAEIDRLQSDAM